MGIRVLAVSGMVDAGLWAGLSSGRSADVTLACGDLPAEYLGALMNDLNAPPRGVGDGDDAPHRGFRCYHDLIAGLTDLRGGYRHAV